jgi:spoIIIJ-associated protein
LNGRRYFSAETEAQAVLEAAGHFGVSPAELDYRPVNKKQGFLRRPRVVIEVDPGRPAKSGEPPVSMPPAVQPHAAPPAGPAISARPQSSEGDDEGWRAPAAIERLGGAAGVSAAVARVVELSGLRLEAGHPQALEAGDAGEIAVDVRGPDRSVLIARDAEVLGAFEHLVRRMVRHQTEIVALDSEGYRANRVSTLRRRAAAAAAEVRRSGEPVLLEPLSAAERRVVHLAIQEEAGVASQSEGEGERKRIRVALRAPQLDS